MAKVAVRGHLRPASAIWRQKWPSGALRGHPRGPTIREKLLLQPFKNVVILLVLDRFGAQCLQHVAPTNSFSNISKSCKTLQHCLSKFDASRGDFDLFPLPFVRFPEFADTLKMNNVLVEQSNKIALSIIKKTPPEATIQNTQQIALPRSMGSAIRKSSQKNIKSRSRY